MVTGVVSWKKCRYSGFHFSCSKLWTAADACASSFALKLNEASERMCHGVPSSPVSKRVRKGSKVPHKYNKTISTIEGVFLGCDNVTNSPFTVDILTCRAEWVRCNSVKFGWMYCRVSLSVSPMAILRFVSIDAIRLSRREMLLWPCGFFFQKLMAANQAGFGAAKNFPAEHTLS